ncbi:MAG: sugar phosphate isomerase/epimerase [Planctomycetes bacterium]|nr:sugar phosphate isomerase/epimerase [Planctomycetota bacterium]
MDQWQVGCDTWAFRDKKLREFVPALGSLGFDCVNLSSVSGACPHVLPEHSRRRLEAIRRVCESNHLPISAVQTSASLAAAGQDEREDAIDLVRRYVEMCTVLAASMIVIDLGGMEPEEEINPVVQRTRPALKEVAEIAAAAEIRLAIESDTQAAVNTAELDRKLIDAADHPVLGANYNVGNLQAAGHDALNAIDTLAGKIGNVHLKDVVAKDGQLTYCGLGEGTVDFGAILRKLIDTGYKGAIIVEYDGEGSPLAGVQSSIGHLQPILSKLG